MAGSPAPAWVLAEKEFESFYSGKNFVYAFEDTREAQKTGGSRRIFTKARPSDYLVTCEGETFFAEVKSCSGQTSFPFSMIAKEQWSAAIQCSIARGKYFFFIKSEVHQKWFKIPAHVLIDIFNVKKSLKWEEAAPYEFRR